MAFRDSILAAWRTNSRTTDYLVERLPSAVWEAAPPEIPTRPIRSIAAHLHNCRRSWIHKLGEAHGVPVPESVDRHRLTRPQLLAALPRSAAGIRALLELGLEHEGRIPPSPAYSWRNLPLDVGHVLAYFAAHEAHHRGQIVMVARQLGERLPNEVTGGLWQWTRRSREVDGAD